MLISILNVCSQEELDEEDEEEAMALNEPAEEGQDEPMEEDDSPERRAVVKQKILAVGRMSRVFALLREEAERVSELKTATPSGKLPYGSLASGNEGVKETVHNFDDARKVDIENERLPPDLIDADEASLSSLEGRVSSMDESRSNESAPPTPGSPAGPASPDLSGHPPSAARGHRRGHSRNSSLGTTATSSPSNRRRSLESTVNMIREALAGEEGVDESSFEKLAESVASPSSPRHSRTASTESAFGGASR